MEELISSDILNSINKNLQNFITTSYNEDDILDVYVSFDYDEVKDIFKNKFSNGLLTPKPVVHLWENTIYNNSNFYLENEEKGEKLYCHYNVYIVIDPEVQSEKKRKFLLNELASQLKYKFDNYKGQLPFKDVKISLSSGMLGRNTDNLYAVHQKLTFHVLKTLR